MNKRVYEVYWETITAKGETRRYSRIFNHEVQAVPFYAAKTRKPSTGMAFVREIEVVHDERGRASEVRFVTLLGAYVPADRRRAR